MDAQAEFYKTADEWFYRLLERDPVAATQVGEHRWDDRLPDRNLDALQEEHDYMVRARDALDAIDTAGFSPDARIDHTLMVHLVKSFIRQYEKRRLHLRDPGYYVNDAMTGVFVLIMKEFAPLPDRLRAVLARMEQIPRLLGEARHNIVPADVPEVWALVALEQARQAPALLSGMLPAMAAKAAPQLETGFRQTGARASEAALAFAGYLEQQVLGVAGGDFAAGQEVFDEMLREDHMVDYDAGELLDTGRRLFGETEDRLAAVAREIDPSISVTQVLERAKSDHPTAEGLLKAYEDAMQAARRYVLDHDIATIPSGETLRVIETPEYLRPLLPYAAYMPPGILEEQQDGFFLVTPVDPSAAPEEQEARLKGHSYAKLPVTALHEAYPGHHLQLVWANRQKTIPRRLGSFLSSLFIEGWAFYCEELMEEVGYISAPLQRLGRLKDQLWRAARIIIDVSLHTRGMSVDEAVDFLVEKCRLERANAAAEVRRYTGSPTQPQSYLMGKLAIMDLIEGYRRANPATSLRQMHDAILGCGSLPPRLMRECLLGPGRGTS
jgi:uncharacterized protein (DUF885 family)